jgi:glycerate dehydrogenase
VNRERLNLMKPSAILINTSRGPVVNEADVAEALNQGRIAAFGADVVSVEPIEASNPLLNAKNCFLTPHIAWATKEARQRLIDICVENVKAFVQDNPQNVVNER